MGSRSMTAKTIGAAAQKHIGDLLEMHEKNMVATADIQRRKKLADDAFAYACNAGNRATVALACQISYVAPARAGDVLSASAREQSRTGRTGVYDVEVRLEGGALVALFRGQAYEVRGRVVQPEA